MKSRNIYLIVLLTVALTGTACAQSLEATTNPVRVDVGKKPEVVTTPVTQPIAVKTEQEIMVTLESLGITRLPKYHALIVGVSEYANAGAGLPSLEMPAKDAERLAQVLTNRYAFDPAYVTLLKNPTRAEILNQFDALVEKVGEQDNLLIFYAGHGFYDKKTDFGYWLPSDAKTTTRSEWIANSTIKDYIGAIKSKHTLLITDACFGGSIFKTRSVSNVIMRFNEIYKENSRKALTSGNLSEVPDKSLFIKYLLKMLEDNKDVFLPSSVLFSRIYEPILNNAPVTPQYGVVQGAGDEGGDFVFIKKD